MWHEAHSVSYAGDDPGHCDNSGNADKVPARLLALAQRNEDGPTAQQIQQAESHTDGPCASQLLGQAGSQDEALEERRMAQAYFLREITKELSVAAAALPTTPAAPAAKKKPEPKSSLWRSRRIALSGNARPALERAQCVLMRKLGILSDQEAITQEAREAYTKLFEHPLSRPQLMAVAALFGWTIP